MKLFQTAQNNLKLVKFDPNEIGSSFVLIRQHWTCFSQSSLAVVSLTVYLLHDANTVKEFMDSMFLATSATLIFISFTSIVFKTAEMYAFFDNAEKAANKRLKNRSDLEETYEEANRQVELFSKIIYFVIVKLSLPAFLLPLAILSYYRYFFTDLGGDAFTLTVPTWFPFDWKNPHGYAIALTLQFLMYLNPYRYLACIASLGFGGFWFINTFIKDGIDDIRTINDLARRGKSLSQMMKIFKNSICAHSDLKQLIGDFAYLNDTSLTATFAGCTILICISMLTIQIETSLGELDLIVLLISIFYAFFVLFLLFGVCELGARTCNIFDELDDELIQSYWYLFPLEIQKMLPTLMINTQRPVVIKCFGSVSCTRGQFKKVVNMSYQFFMVLRKFYN